MSYKDTDICFFYHPTTVAVIDDSSSYLANIRLQLSKDFPTVLFDDSKEALSILKARDNSNHINEFIKITPNDMEHDDCSISNSRTVNVNLSNLYKKIYDNNRFENIVASLVDFDMPYIDGIEFCSQLGVFNRRLKKIMLTGKADNNIAVKAFNNGTIDKFIIKGTDDSRDSLLSVLKNQTQKYFSDLSKSLQNELLISPDSPIINDYYLNIFERTKQQSNFVEYYLLDLFGSFLFLDKYAQPTILLVRTEADIDSYCKIATDSCAPKSIVEKLHSRSHLLYLHTEDDYNTSPEEWDRFLYPSARSEDGSFFYTIINKEIGGIKLRDVKSFDEYLHELSS